MLYSPPKLSSDASQAHPSTDAMSSYFENRSAWLRELDNDAKRLATSATSQPRSMVTTLFRLSWSGQWRLAALSILRRHDSVLALPSRFSARVCDGLSEYSLSGRKLAVCPLCRRERKAASTPTMLEVRSHPLCALLPTVFSSPLSMTPIQPSTLTGGQADWTDLTGGVARRWTSAGSYNSMMSGYGGNERVWKACTRR